MPLTPIVVSIDENGIIDWPWQLTWSQVALWEILNFVVLAAIAITCRPTGKFYWSTISMQLIVTTHLFDRTIKEPGLFLAVANI